MRAVPRHRANHPAVPQHARQRGGMTVRQERDRVPVAYTRWINLYARMTKQEYATWVDRLVAVKRIDTARTTSLPVMDAADALAAWGLHLHEDGADKLERWEIPTTPQPPPPRRSNAASTCPRLLEGTRPVVHRYLHHELRRGRRWRREAALIVHRARLHRSRALTRIVYRTTPRERRRRALSGRPRTGTASTTNDGQNGMSIA